MLWPVHECYHKEMSSKPIQPDTLKNALDPQDGLMDARHNHSKKGDITGFPITFVMSGCSNKSITIASASDGADHGCGGKIYELTVGYNMVDNPDVNNPRERTCDTTVPEKSRNGDFDGELFFWVRAMYKTLLNDVCTTRLLTPLPPSLCETRASMQPEQETMAAKVQEWFNLHTVACSKADAHPAKDVKTRLESDLGKVDGTVWAECLKDQKNQGTMEKRGESKKYYFKHTFDGVSSPCKLK